MNKQEHFLNKNFNRKYKTVPGLLFLSTGLHEKMDLARVLWHLNNIKHTRIQRNDFKGHLFRIKKIGNTNPFKK